MTLTTDSNYIKTMFFGITGMMILFCLFAARTLQFIWPDQFTNFDSIINRVYCLVFIWVISFVFLTGFSLGYFAFCALGISSVCGHAVDCFFVFCFTNVRAYFAIIIESVFAGFVFLKLRNIFDFFALRTLFCYDCLRHGLFPCKRLLLEPMAGYTPVVGSFYYKSQRK